MELASSFSLGLTQLTADSEVILPNNVDPPKVVDHNVVNDSIGEIIPTSDDANTHQDKSIEEDSQEETEVIKNVASTSKSKVPKRHAKKGKKEESITTRTLLPKGLQCVCSCLC